MPVPIGYLRWLALGIALFLLAIGITITANAFGLTGFAAASSDPGTKVTATVSAGAPCTAEGAANERVTFSLDGQEREARFNGCGHAEGEQVDITVPADPPANLVVYAAPAAPGPAKDTPGTRAAGPGRAPRSTPSRDHADSHARATAGWRAVSRRATN